MDPIKRSPHAFRTLRKQQRPRSDFTEPWAVIPPIGFLVAIWIAERYRGRMRDKDGWRGKLGIFYDAIHVVWSILSQPRRYGYAPLGGAGVMIVALVPTLWYGAAVPFATATH